MTDNLLPQIPGNTFRISLIWDEIRHGLSYNAFRGSNAISVSQFSNGEPDLDNASIRYIREADGTLWFAATDICALLGFRGHRSTIAQLDRGQYGLATFSGTHIPNCACVISEGGFYTLVFSSNKAQLKPLSRLLIGMLIKNEALTFGEMFAAIPSSANTKMRNKASRTAHRQIRRAHLANATGKHTGNQIIALLSQQHGLCAYCDKPMNDDCTVDHVWPLSKGGSNDIDNIALCHKSCNSKKGAKLPDSAVRQ